MKEIDNGGPAFPTPSTAMWTGMSLRDWFAGMAMQSMLSPDATHMPTLAEDAYRVADAMIYQRTAHEKETEE